MKGVSIVTATFLLGPALVAAAAPPAMELSYAHIASTFYVGEQGPPSICVQPDGTTVIVWMDGDFYSTGLDGSGTGIQMRRWFPDGTFGPETTVNTITEDHQIDPQVACASDGDFVVVWTSGLDLDGPDGSGQTIAARRYDSDGTPKAPEFVVNSTTLGSQNYPDVCGFPDGGFVAVWMDEGGYIWGRRFDSTGVAIGDEFGVDFASLELSSDPSVGCAADGSFVAIWASEENDGDVLFQRFDSSGTPAGSMTTANEVTDGQQGVYYTDLDDPADIAVAPDGSFVIAWQDWPYYEDSRVSVRRFAADGMAQGLTIDASTVEYLVYPFQYDVSVAVDADGRFAVTYNESEDYYSPGQVARVFRADGAPAGLPVRFGGAGEYGYADYPAIASHSGGAFAVAWSSSVFAEDDSLDVLVNAIGGSMCSATPASSCRVTPPGESKLQARDADEVDGDKIKWLWKKGAETPYGALGNPVSGLSRYEFCLYDGSAAQQPLVDGLVAPRGGSPFPRDWKATGSKGFKFSTYGSEYNGYLSKLGIKSGEPGKASVKLQVQGFESSALLPFTGPVVAQLLVHGNDGIECWQTTFTTLEINTESKVKIQGP